MEYCVKETVRRWLDSRKNYGYFCINDGRGRYIFQERVLERRYSTSSVVVAVLLVYLYILFFPLNNTGKNQQEEARPLVYSQFLIRLWVSHNNKLEVSDIQTRSFNIFIATLKNR